MRVHHLGRLHPCPFRPIALVICHAMCPSPRLDPPPILFDTNVAVRLLPYAARPLPRRGLTGGGLVSQQSYGISPPPSRLTGELWPLHVPFPPAWGKVGMGGKPRWPHPQPHPPPSRGRGRIPPLVSPRWEKRWPIMSPEPARSPPGSARRASPGRDSVRPRRPIRYAPGWVG